MKKWLYLSLVMVPMLVLSISFPTFAQDSAPVPCTDTPEYPQVKVAQVPIPWQFWAIEDGNVIDRIRISPTWLNPPFGQPAGEGPVFIQRQVASVPLLEPPIPLEGLVWDFDRDRPAPDLDWIPANGLIEVIPSLDVEYEFVDETYSAVLVAYEVMTDLNPVGEPVGHFINEAVLSYDESTAIVQVLVNFDIHNDTGRDVTNFELDFLGLDFGCGDVIHALGFVVGTGEPWGANPGSPLVVRPIMGGTEVKWVQPDRPLHDSEWLHGGLVFELPALIEGVDATVQGYWTVIPPPVGGEVYPVDKPGILGPWIGVALILILATAAGALAVKRHRSA